MQNHHHTTLSHSRAEKRQDYAHIYVCVREDAGDALRDSKDGLLLAWTDWAAASELAGRTGMIVVNWFWFLAKYLPRLAEKPEAARIFAETKRGRRVYHAELDASAEELRTLNNVCEWERERTPAKVGEKLRNAKVWPEDDALSDAPKPLSLAEISAQWMADKREEMRDGGYALRAGAGATIEFKSLRVDNAWVRLVLPNGAASFASIEDRDTVLRRLQGERTP